MLHRRLPKFHAVVDALLKAQQKGKVSQMVINATRVFAFIPCAALLVSGALQASTIKSEKVEIPFAFSVQNNRVMLPPGQYQVEQQQGSEVASLVNTKTGERVNVLRPENTHEKGKAHLVFVQTAEGHSLKSIS